MNQDDIRQHLTKAFSLAPMTIAVLMGVDENQVHPRLGDVFADVLSRQRYQRSFTQGFKFGGVNQTDMVKLVEGGMDEIDAHLELATVAINKVVETTEQALFIKVRFFEFAEEMALGLENLRPGQEASLSINSRGKLAYLNEKLGLQADLNRMRN